MSAVLPVRTAVTLAVAVNVVVQVLLLGLLAIAGEWRVWRFLADSIAMIDAAVVLSIWAVKWTRLGVGEAAA
jgi:hypothetical protein